MPAMTKAWSGCTPEKEGEVGMKLSWEIALKAMIYIIIIAISILLVRWIWSWDIPDWMKVLLIAK